MLDATRCQLRAGHRSAHAARTGTALTTWANPGADEKAKLVALDWYVESSRPAPERDPGC